MLVGIGTRGVRNITLLMVMHEQPETNVYRPIFTKNCLCYKIRAHCWIQMLLIE